MNPARGTSPPRDEPNTGKPIRLKDVAAHLGLSPTTVSLVMNRSPAAKGIPPETQERVRAAAEELGYRPNFIARSLRRQRTFAVGVLLPEISEGYAAGVLGGIEDQLLQEGYFYLVAGHHSKPDLFDDYLQLLTERSVEGLILVNTPIESALALPAVAVAGHREIEGVTNVVIDHEMAARLALAHLAELGHRRIAFFKGHAHSADTESRWQAIVGASADLGLEIDPRLTLQLSGDPAGEEFSPEEGYREGDVFGRKLLEVGAPFTRALRVQRRFGDRRDARVQRERPADSRRRLGRRLRRHPERGLPEPQPDDRAAAAARDGPAGGRRAAAQAGRSGR